MIEMSMTEAETVALVLDTLRNANQARLPQAQLMVSPDAPLFGSGPLDSLGLVSLLIDLEDALEARGYEVNLSDAKAMSSARSPFRNVPALVAHIRERIGAVP